MANMRRSLRVAAAFGAAVSVSACGLFGGGDDEAPSSSPPQRPSVTASDPGSASPPDGQAKPVAERVAQFSYTSEPPAPFPESTTYLVASMYGIYRRGDTAQLQLRLRLVGDAPADFGGRVQFLLSGPSPIEDADPSFLDSTGMTLLDMPAGKAYLVARDAESYCLCSVNPTFGANITALVSATYAAPPETVSSMSVYLPMFGVFPDIPITDGDPPETPEPSIGPGQSAPKILVATPHSTRPPARKPVVDISAQVAKLDLSVRQEKDRVTLDANVLFAFDKATLTAKARSRIAEAAAILREKATGTAEVRGYTDSKGSQAYNVQLSQRRAEAVRKALQPRLAGTGIRLTAKGYGEKDPVAPNTVGGKDNPEGRALNRRVEIVYHE
ncbi:MAG: OmpA family protein [Actinophytocola sp.]|nr:OmpA family protein [Actinophytocola sp.]